MLADNNWEVEWDASSYSAESRAIITLPVLLEMDTWTDTSVVLGTNNEAGTSLSVYDTSRHMGHSGLTAESITIDSVLPRTSQASASNTWTPSGVTVLYVNGSGSYDITSQAVITTSPSSSGNGYVNVVIASISAILGHGLRQNEDIRVSFGVSGASNPTDQIYDFCQTSTMVTSSGTPSSDTSCQSAAIPGVGGIVQPPPGGGGGGGIVVTPTLFADITRESGGGYFIAENLLNVTATYSIVDTGNKGIKDVKAIIYIPEHGQIDLSTLSFLESQRLIVIKPFKSNRDYLREIGKSSHATGKLLPPFAENIKLFERSLYGNHQPGNAGMTRFQENSALMRSCCE